MSCLVWFKVACPALALLLCGIASAASGPIGGGKAPPSPAGLSARQRDLFFTPGGLYTAADIRANGSMTPYQKYADVMAAHNFSPKTGDRTCPITKTVANPRFKWIVGGKSYTFCCPPCIEEFVARAKTRPSAVHPPDYYVQRLGSASPVSVAGMGTAGSGPLSAHPWRMFGGNARHTGVSADRGAQEGDIKWSFATEAKVLSSPAVGADGTLYAGSYDNCLYALKADGTVKWKFETGGVVTATPAIGSDGTIYDGSADGSLYAFHPDGTLKWKFPVPFASLVNSPTLGPDGTLYLGVIGDDLYAIQSDGTLKWKVSGVGGVNGSPAIGSDGTLYAGSADHKLCALDPEDGSIRWQLPLGGAVAGSPAVDTNGVIYVGSSDFNLYAITPQGSVKWKFRTGAPIYSTPALGAHGVIYVGSGDGYLYALASNGTCRWKIEIGSFGTNSPVIGADGTIYAGAVTLWAIGPTGKELWKIPMGEDSMLSTPAIANAIVYAGGSDGKVYAIE